MTSGVPRRLGVFMQHGSEQRLLDRLLGPATMFEHGDTLPLRLHPEVALDAVRRIKNEYTPWSKNTAVEILNTSTGAAPPGVVSSFVAPGEGRRGTRVAYFTSALL
jgi:hypothetical protein